jgi:gas vesicle protein
MLNQPPDWYAEANETWAKNQGTLQAWSDTTLRDVTRLPKELTMNSEDVLALLDAALTYSSALILDPLDLDNKRLLMKKLDALSTEVKYFYRTTDNLVKHLMNGAGDFVRNAKEMQGYAILAGLAAGADKDKIDDLNREIANLRTEIENEAKEIAKANNEIIAGYVIGGVGILTGFTGIGLILLIPAAVLLGVGYSALKLNTAAMAEANDKIRDYSSQLPGLAQDAAALFNMADTLTKFADTVNDFTNALKPVIQPWKEAEDYFSQVVSKLDSIETATSDDWVQTTKDLTEIQTKWKELMTAVEKLIVPMKVNRDAALAIGMDDTQVQQALNNSTSVDIIEYLAAA